MQNFKTRQLYTRRMKLQTKKSFMTFGFDVDLGMEMGVKCLLCCDNCSNGNRSNDFWMKVIHSIAKIFLVHKILSKYHLPTGQMLIGKMAIWMKCYKQKINYIARIFLVYNFLSKRHLPIGQMLIGQMAIGWNVVNRK